MVILNILISDLLRISDFEIRILLLSGAHWILMIIDFLRLCRKTLYTIGHVQVFGFHIDFLLHFLAAFILALLLRRRFNTRRTALFLMGLIAAKELIDLFAKSRLEYIRPPGLDLAMDVIGGIAGLCLALALAARFPSKRYMRNV